MPKIKFILTTDHDEKYKLDVDENPKPAKNFISEEYKNLPGIIDNDLRFPTSKKCIPFLDAMTNGYIIPFFQDYLITITKIKKGDKTPLEGDAVYSPESDVLTEVRMRVGGNDGFIHPAFQIPEGYQENKRPAGKFENKWYVKTPPGYSCLFIHPINQPKTDYALASGIVDTDVYNQPILFPYFLTKQVKEEQTQIHIKRGDPMVQIIPFKREHWTSWSGKIKNYGRTTPGFGIMVDMYKKIFWQKKKYD